MAGLIVREEYFSFESFEHGSRVYENTKALIDNVAFSWIGPVFFVVLGTQLVFDWDIFISVVPHTFALTVGILVSQIASAALAAKYTSGTTTAESMLIGLGILGRAEIAFVVSWSPRRKADAINDIDSRRHTYYVQQPGTRRADVHVVTMGGKKHLRTDPDASTANNLDNLPDC